MGNAIPYPAPANRRLRHLEAFAKGLTLFAVITVVVTGFFIHLRLSGPDLQIIRIPWWGVAKWYLLDVHVTLSFAAIAGGGLWGLLAWWRKGRPDASDPWHRATFLVAGLLFGVLLVRTVVNDHPIFVQTIRATDYPSSSRPDFITLTWSGDPKTTQAVQWRTGPDAAPGTVRYRPADGDGPWQETLADTRRLVADYMANDYDILWHTAELSGLEPGTKYTYQVGYEEGWLGERPFRTAPAGPEPFSFVYIGDSQEGLLDYGELMDRARERNPDARFYLHAGDLVNRGCERDDWDLFFHASRNVFDRHPIVPTVGNHDECPGHDPYYYLNFLSLPGDGSPARPPGETYTLAYGDALVVVLNSNLDVAAQAPWLEEQLRDSDATWKFVLWHHPAYVAKRHRDNAEVVRHWTPMLDQYGVDIAFQGHDHVYMRTKPIRGGEYMDRLEDGTIYLVSVAGTKFYKLLDRDYMEVAIPDLHTYQVVDIDGNTLDYRAYDLEGNIIDAFRLEK